MGLISGIGRPVIYSPSTGGGTTGLPLGPFSDWSGLPASADNFSLAFLYNIGPEDSYGYAVYDSESAEWQLLFGWFLSLDDLNAFSEPINSQALVGVGAGLDGPTSTRFQWDSGASEWVRTPAGTGYYWDLTETELLTGGDPSGIGLVQEGDWGSYTPAGGAPIVVRYSAATPVLSGVAGGPQAQWLPPEVYAGTPEIQAYLVGDEVVSDDVALNAQGWLTVVRTNGTITSQTTRVRLATTAASARVELQTLTANVSSTTKVYARFLYRAVVGNGTTNLSTGVYFGEFGDGIGGAGLRPVYYSAIGSNIFFWSGAGVTNTGISGSAQPAPPNLTGTDELIELFYDINTGISTLRRNGVESAASLRSSSVSTSDRYALVAFSGTGATQTATLDLSKVMVAKW